MSKPNTTTTYTIDPLTCHAADIEADNFTGNFEQALARALETYYQIAADDAENIVALWTQDYNLVALIYAGQTFVPQQSQTGG